MNNTHEAILNELIDTFDNIYEILVREKENNWIRGIKSIRDRLKEAKSSEADFNEICKEISTSYRNMNSGAGSFADFMVWRDDFDERLRLNKEFETLVDRAWSLLNL